AVPDLYRSRSPAGYKKHPLGGPGVDRTDPYRRTTSPRGLSRPPRPPGRVIRFGFANTCNPGTVKSGPQGMETLIDGRGGGGVVVIGPGDGG
ncbi:hypothetical protein GWI33_003155, partial [Rhynchophorus ferrugineus]